jgi:hypothetical protein
VNGPAAPAAQPEFSPATYHAHDPRGSWVPPWRLISAKFLELRKRRGMIVALVILSIGIAVVIDAIFLILHAAAPHSYGPAGGISKFRAFTLAFVQLFGISAILVGAAAGSSDLTDGVFRHLVVTGRSRFALFAARVPAGLMLIIPITAFAYTIEALVGYFCAPSGNTTTFGITRATPSNGGPVTVVPHLITRSATPDVHLLVVTGLFLMLGVVVAFVLGLGLGSLTGSRYVTVAILIAMQLIVTPILSGVSIPHLINLQRAFIGVALAQLEPSGLIGIGGGGGGGGGGGNGSLLSIPPMPTFGLAIVITAWVVGFLALGAWRTVRRDV